MCGHECEREVVVVAGATSGVPLHVGGQGHLRPSADLLLQPPQDRLWTHRTPPDHALVLLLFLAAYLVLSLSLSLSVSGFSVYSFLERRVRGPEPVVTLFLPADVATVAM